MSDDEGTSPSGVGGDSKKPTSSTYYQWSVDKAKRAEELNKLGVDIRPKAVDGTPSPAVTSQASVGSAWNSAGTWEERDVTSRAIGHIKTNLLEIRHTTSSGLRFNVTNVSKCDGSVNLVFSRGKAKPGYEVSLTFEWALNGAGDEEEKAKGSIVIDEISDSEGSDMFGHLRAECTHAVAPLDKAAARSAALETKELIRKFLQDWVEAVKAM